VPSYDRSSRGNSRSNGRMNKFFVVVSGLPGSGESTLVQPTGSGAGSSAFWQDVILGRLLESKGFCDIEWRGSLSRESDFLGDVPSVGGGRARSMRRIRNLKHSRQPRPDPIRATDSLLRLARDIRNRPESRAPGPFAGNRRIAALYPDVSKRRRFQAPDRWACAISRPP
jgi:hypothetical protein